MYQCGDQVIYGVHGICRILDLEKKMVSRKRVEYYVLEPVDQPGARFYVPTQNQAAVSKLRKVLTREQIDTLLKSDEVHADVWIPDENLRKQRYRELLGSGDRGAMLAMISTLYYRKQALAAAGKKFHLCDDNFLREAQKLLSAEFASVLEIPVSEVGSYIQKVICE